MFAVVASTLATTPELAKGLRHEQRRPYRKHSDRPRPKGAAAASQLPGVIRRGSPWAMRSVRSCGLVAHRSQVLALTTTPEPIPSTRRIEKNWMWDLGRSPFDRGSHEVAAHRNSLGNRRAPAAGKSTAMADPPPTNPNMSVSTFNCCPRLGDPGLPGGNDHAQQRDRTPVVGQHQRGAHRARHGQRPGRPRYPWTSGATRPLVLHRFGRGGRGGRAHPDVVAVPARRG